ncbi:MAG: ROK family protein [Patescibacteria group bacterium]|nr:ROK family protein [Patescibacteria group bacterium]
MSIKPKTYTIGLDIGGTTIKGILFDGEKIITDHELGTPKDNLKHFLVIIKAVVDPLLEKTKELKVKINGIGVGVAGIINADKTINLHSPNISIINNINLPEKIEELFNLPVLADNDTNCLVLAESLLGAGKNRNSVYGIIIGTGIGGGWYLNGNIHDGAHGGAGEPGEMIIEAGSGMGLETAYHQLMQNNPNQMAEEAYHGDVLALKSYEELGNIIGITIANISNLINPEIFILYGGALESSDLFLSKTKKIAKKYIASSEAKKKIKIVKSKLVGHAGAIGAALLFNNKK